MEYEENLSLLEKYSVILKRDRSARTISFGLIEIENSHKELVFGSENAAAEGTSGIGIKLENYPKTLNCWYVVNEKQSQEYFYRIQRLRKIWWMRVVFKKKSSTISSEQLTEFILK